MAEVFHLLDQHILANYGATVAARADLWRTNRDCMVLLAAWVVDCFVTMGDLPLQCDDMVGVGRRPLRRLTIRELQEC